MTFKASWDSATKAITLFTPIIFLAIIYIQFNNLNSFNYTSFLLVFILFIITMGVCYLFSIKLYELSDDELIIHRPISNVIIKRANIQDIQFVKKAALNWSIRTFGVGGVFGYYGKYWKNGLGYMTWYTTKRSDSILITTNTNKILITPDEIEGMIQELNKTKTI